MRNTLLYHDILCSKSHHSNSSNEPLVTLVNYYCYQISNTYRNTVIPLLRQPFQKTTSASASPSSAGSSFFLSLPHLQSNLSPISSLFQGKLQFLSPDRPLPSSLCLHPPSPPLLYLLTPPPHPPPCYPQLKLTSSSRRKNHRKYGSQGMRFGSHHDTALSYSHSFLQVGINGFGRIGRIVSSSHLLPLASPPGRGGHPSLS